MDIVALDNLGNFYIDMIAAMFMSQEAHDHMAV